MDQSRRRKKGLMVELNEDRISALPDSLIHHILSFLPSTKQSIQTVILSKRWLNQWTRVPVLIFDSGEYSDDFNSEGFARFIDSTLLQYDCSKIRKLQLSYEFNKDSNLSSKLRFAMTRNVEELILNCYFSDVDGSYLLPKFLSYNTSLVKLEMLSCYFMDDWIINLGSLNVFKVVDCLSKRLVANVLSGSPSLESLHINDYGNPFAAHAIASKSLKILTLDEFNISEVSCIEISCPNLEEFSLHSSGEYAGLPEKVIENVVSNCVFLSSLTLKYCCFDEKLVIASKSLKKLVLMCLGQGSKVEISCPNLEELKSDIYHEITFNLMNNLEISQYGECHVKKAKKIFQQLENVKELTMASWFIKILSEVGMGVLSYPWSKNKILTLDGPNFEHLPGIICALRSACMLERLVIKLKVYEGELTSNASGENDWNSNGTVVKCLVSHLKTVEIIGLSKQDAKCELVLNFIQYLLKNTRILEKLVLVISKDGGTGFAFEVAQKVSSFPRRSRHAIVELLCA